MSPCEVNFSTKTANFNSSSGAESLAPLSNSNVMKSPKSSVVPFSLSRNLREISFESSSVSSVSVLNSISLNSGGIKIS